MTIYRISQQGPKSIVPTWPFNGFLHTPLVKSTSAIHKESRDLIITFPLIQPTHAFRRKKVTSNVALFTPVTIVQCVAIILTCLLAIGAVSTVGRFSRFLPRRSYNEFQWAALSCHSSGTLVFFPSFVLFPRGADKSASKQGDSNKQLPVQPLPPSTQLPGHWLCSMPTESRLKPIGVVCPIHHAIGTLVALDLHLPSSISIWKWLRVPMSEHSLRCPFKAIVYRPLNVSEWVELVDTK